MPLIEERLMEMAKLPMLKSNLFTNIPFLTYVRTPQVLQLKKSV